MRSAVEPNVLSRRIEQLVALGGGEAEGDGLAATLSAVLAEVTASRADLEGLSSRLIGAVAASRTETGTLVRRVAELVPALEARMAVLEDTLDAMAERLEALARDGAHTTRDQLRALTATAAGIEQRLDAMGPAAGATRPADPA